MFQIKSSFRGGYWFKNFQGTPKPEIRPFSPEKPAPPAIPGASSAWENLPLGTISDLMQQAGVGALGLPTLKSNPIKINSLIIIGLATYPMALPTEIACDNRLNQAAKGILILRKLYQNPATYIGVSRKEPQVLQKIQELLAGSDVKIQALKPKYPQDMPQIFVETFTGQVLPPGKSFLDQGIVVLKLADALAVYDAVVSGIPFYKKIIGLCGTGFQENFALSVDIGTKISEILAKFAKPGIEVRPLIGHALLGDCVEETSVITAKTECITLLEEERSRKFLFFLRPGLRTDSYSGVFANAVLPMSKKPETNVHGELRPCIQCSYCEDVCPRPLYPHLLHKYATHGIADEALSLKLQSCVECGLCSYVCPSKIPIMTNIQKAKQELREAGLME